jgi:hypothetical protein
MQLIDALLVILLKGGVLKLAGVIGSFAVSLALFIFSYLTVDDGYGWLLFGVGGFIFAVIGAYIAMSKGGE